MIRLRRLLLYLKPYRPQILGVILFTVGATAASLLAPWLVRELIRVIEGGADAREMRLSAIRPT